MIPPSQAPRVAVIGGSLGGMMAAIALRGAGCSVDVFERVPQRLEGQGAGLRIVPEMAQLLGERAGINLAEVSTFVAKLRHMGAGNQIVADQDIPGQFTSWGSLHRALAVSFGQERYHLGETCVGISQRADSVELQFAGGRIVQCDLAVFADGILSTGRQLLAPEAALSYAGYVGWRGFVAETELTRETRALFSDAVTRCVIDRSHATVYPIPDPIDQTSGGRFFNFVWYRNVASGSLFDALMTDRTGLLRPIAVPAGLVQERHIAELKAAARELLPAAAAEVITKTREPFLQAIYDLTVSRMVFGRACLVGDAAFVSRPHAGAATGKAAVNAWRLADLLDASQGDVAAALAAWEPEELRLGGAFVERNRLMGNRSQFEGHYDPADPEHLPGLYGPGR